jgi:hypothetical protein
MKSRRESPFDCAGLRPASPHTGSPAAVRSRCARPRRPVLNGLALRQSSSTTCSRHITTTCRSLPGVIRAALENIPGSPPWPVRAFRARRRLLGSCRSRSRGASGQHLAILPASTPGSTPESFSRTIAGARILERAREWQRILLRKSPKREARRARTSSALLLGGSARDARNRGPRCARQSDDTEAS